MSIRRVIAISDSASARLARRIYYGVADFSIPAPKAVFLPVLVAVNGIRTVWDFLVRVLICEPLFKSACARVGRNVHTGVFLHYIKGSGDIVLGDHVIVDGKCHFVFGARFAERPELVVGSRTCIGHNCTFVVGKRIDIGEDCRIADNVRMLDSPGHPLNAAERRLGLAAHDADVRPIRVGNNVWIGSGAVLFPGVTVGDDSVIATRAIVSSDVPPASLMSGHPARRIMTVPTSTQLVSNATCRRG